MYNPDIHRRKSIRLKHYDYSSVGAYFVTICVCNRKNSFGIIKNGKIRLNNLGEIAGDEWQKTPEIRRDMNIQLDEFVIMPNHMHGIIMIGAKQHNICRDTMHRVLNDETTMHQDAKHCVPTNRFGGQSKNLSSIIRGYKSAVTMYARKHGINFKWQTRFYEHIIRNNKELNQIREYIQNNPLKWHLDRENPQRTGIEPLEDEIFENTL
jgi:REP element-mobilizing transposase RayT